MSTGIERRGAIELRAAGGRRLEGHAAIFNSAAKIGRFKEIIKPGAFRASLLSNKDVLALSDHDPTKVLARTRSGSLRLSEDSRGLAFSLDVPDTQAGRDVLALAERGDLGGCSFGFRATSERWPQNDVRELLAVDLIEISIVSAFPAYSATEVSARSAAAGVGASLRLRQRFLETVR